MSNRKNNLLSPNQEANLKKNFLKNFTVLLAEILSLIFFLGYKKEKKIINLQPQATRIK